MIIMMPVGNAFDYTPLPPLLIFLMLRFDVCGDTKDLEFQYL